VDTRSTKVLILDKETAHILNNFVEMTDILNSGISRKYFFLTLQYSRVLFSLFLGPKGSQDFYSRSCEINCHTKNLILCLIDMILFLLTYFNSDWKYCSRKTAFAALGCDLLHLANIWLNRKINWRLSRPWYTQVSLSTRTLPHWYVTNGSRVIFILF